MKSRGPLDALTATVNDVAGALRRRRESRALRVYVYDDRGQAQALDPDADPGRELAAIAEPLLARTVAPSDRR